MRPEDRQIASGDPRGQIQAPVRSASAAQDAVADIARTQLDSIYSQGQAQPQQDASSEIPNAYRRTHEAAHTASQEQWKQYHSAWQDYYQKYYEHYYVGAVQQVHEAYAHKPQDEPAPAELGMTHEEAVDDLRSQLLGKVQAATKKVRGSRHFIPISAALVVLLLFTFLQYNQFIIGNVKAYVTPIGAMDPQDIPVDPNASLSVGPEPMLIINKINVKVPVDYTAKPDQASQLRAMENGVAHFGIPGANSKPGQVGNTVISGHSSNDFLDGGKYKFVFALLERLKVGDTIELHYEGTRYTYIVTGTKVVKPTDVASLVYPTTKPELTLITCTPLGTALNRLLVTAEQVSPSPSTAATAPAASGSTDKSSMPGNSPTLFERMFGG